jgi:hypothetical protein
VGGWRRKLFSSHSPLHHGEYIFKKKNVIAAEAAAAAAAASSFV